MVPSFHRAVEVKWNPGTRVVLFALATDSMQGIPDTIIWQGHLTKDQLTALNQWYEVLQKEELVYLKSQNDLACNHGILPPPPAEDGIWMTARPRPVPQSGREYLQNDSLMLDLVSHLEKLEIDSQKLMEALEDVRRYLDNPILRVVLEKPLTVRFLFPGFTPEERQQAIDKLPAGDTLFLDIGPCPYPVTEKMLAPFYAKYAEVIIVE